MTPLETHDLLTFIAAYDNRKFDDATVYAWQECLGNISFADGRQAVIDHFAESSEYLMPVHVRQGAIRIRNDRPPTPKLALVGPPPVAPEDRSEETRALIEQVRDALPEVPRDIFRRPEWLMHDRRRSRHRNTEPNPHYAGPPPPDGFPIEVSP